MYAGKPSAGYIRRGRSRRHAEIEAMALANKSVMGGGRHVGEFADRSSRSGSTRRLADTAQGAFNRETLHSVGRLLTMPEQSAFVVPLDVSPIPERCLKPTPLWDRVLSARIALAQERHLPERGLEPTARLALLDALESYVKSLDERGRPVPYALRDELRLMRLTIVPRRQVRPITPHEELGHGHSLR
jgi:hypothetical protein